MSRTILLTGAKGQVGWELVRALSPLGAVHALTRDELDLADEGHLRETVRRLRPSVVVNAAAYTAVDRAESEPEAARTINEIVPGVLAEEVGRCGGAIVHYSTDYVFAGESERPYREEDSPEPLGVYGHTKLGGERTILSTGTPHLIFRTSWVYGARGSNFLRTMLRLARERPELRVVSDQYGAPTWSRLIAEATAQVLARLATPAGFDIPSDIAGTYHMTAGGETTWYDFASAILEMDPHRSEQRCERVVPIRTEEYPTPARRPRYSVLDNTRLESTFGVALPHWRDQLSWVMQDLQAP